MTEDDSLDSVFVVVNSAEDDIFDIDSRFPELSFNRLRGAWFAHDSNADIIDDLSDGVYRSRADAREASRELGDDYAPFPLNAALTDTLMAHRPPTDSSDDDTGSESESLSEMFN